MASPQVLSTKGSSKAHAKFGYAHATWKWTGPGKTGKIKVYVNDQSCKDGYDTFAFMQFKGGRWGNSVITGESRAWNDNSDCVGKGRTSTFPGFTDTFNVLKARVVVCKNDVWGTGDTCVKGTWHKNPKA
ncbi:hypothetical protein AB0L71_20490 [Streptomyces sp. NPDC052052]|uniref:hypothetical protein n=1 Tax=Streptomyces sp. NPDC052052 TaxID=3154756 RepID=UPI003428783A